MKRFALLLPATAILLGCGHSDDDPTVVKPQVLLNPTGQPRNAQESALADRERAGGESAKRQMAEAAKAIEEAKARTGGK